MLREVDLDLDLLAARHASVEPPAIVQNATHQDVMLLLDRPGEFASDEIVREIAGQPEIRKAIEQMEGEMHVGRHAVAMRFDMHGNTRLRCEPPPPFDVGN